MTVNYSWYRKRDRIKCFWGDRLPSPERENDLSLYWAAITSSRQLTRRLECLVYQASLEPVTANSSLV